jgi:hypothetical protein
MNVTLDHAHPTMVAGHPFKGSWVFSTGQLLHPDLKRFGLQSAVLFKPPFPGKNPYDHPVAPTVPAFSDFFSAYFGQKSLNISNDRCSKLFESMKKV